jgi:hypothetical protein
MAEINRAKRSPCLVVEEEGEEESVLRRCWPLPRVTQSLELFVCYVLVRM